MTSQNIFQMSKNFKVIRRICVCNLCNGTGQIVKIPDFDADCCPEICEKCKGAGMLFQLINIVTRPITNADRITLRKVY